jgi:hypothetical protein
MTELPLAEFVPLWVTIQEDGVTAMITPAGDYVCALQLGTLDVRFADDARASAVGEALRSLVSGLDEGTTLHFLLRARDDAHAVVARYEEVSSSNGSPELREYVASRAEWLRAQRTRRSSLYLFASSGSARALARGQLGTRLPFRRPSSLTPARHGAALRRVRETRDRVVAQLAGAGISSRELAPREVHELHFELLNPAAARAGISAPSVVRGEDLGAGSRPELRAYTEAEQLVTEDVVDARAHLLHGGVHRRVCTLKVLPEDGTAYFSALPLLALAERRSDGEPAPFPYWLAVTVHVPPQAAARRVLDYKHKFVEEARRVVARIRAESADQEEADRARQESIRSLFEELHALSSRIAELSVSVLVEGGNPEALAARTEAARRAFAACGNSQLLVEEVTQLPAFLSMLPGAGPYQLRRKGVTTRNAADFLPVFAPWRGSERPQTALLTPDGDLVQLDLFDKTLSSAHHGLVVGDTGSGKSLAMGFLALEAFAAGVEAVLVDNGGSWRPLTELFGGTHLEVDLRTSIAPFQEYAAVRTPSGGLDVEELDSLVLFLETCLRDRSVPALDKLQRDVLSRAIRWSYEARLCREPMRRPLVSDFRDALADMEWSHADDRAIAETLARHLRIYCDGLYGDFLNRPSALRFEAPLLTLDLQHVSQNPETKRVAMSVVMQALAHRARRRRRRTLVAIDRATSTSATTTSRSGSSRAPTARCGSSTPRCG